MARTNQAIAGGPEQACLTVDHGELAGVGAAPGSPTVGDPKGPGVVRGHAQGPFRAEAKDYVAVAEGRMNPMLALATRKFRIEGNMGLAMKLQKVFKRSG